MLKTQTKKIKNRKVSKIIAGILSLLMFATSNGSFLVWGLSEGRLNFLGEPAIAQAKTAEAKVIETADAITVDEIVQKNQPKKHWWEFWKKQNSNDVKSVKSTAGFSDLKTELVAREVLGDKTVDALSDDLKVGKNDNNKNLGSNNDDIDKYIEYIDLTKEQPQKKVGFFKKLWANFVGLFNNDLKTSILEGVDVSNNPEAQNANRQVQHSMFEPSVKNQATMGNDRFGTALFEDDIEGSMRIFAAQRIADGDENFSPAELVIRDGEDIQRMASSTGVFKRVARGEYPGVQPLQELKQLFLDAYGRDDLSFHPLYVHSDNPVEDRKRKLIDEKVKKALELQKEYNRQRAEDVASAVRSNQIKSFAQVIKEKEKDGVDVSVAKKLLQRVSKNNDLGIDASRMQIKTSNLDVVNDLLNSSQQAARIKSAEAEDRESWLAGSWKWFVGWFKNNKNKQITEQEAKDYFGTEGETIAGLGGSDKNNSSYDDLVEKYGKDDMEDGYGDEIAGLDNSTNKGDNQLNDNQQKVASEENQRETDLMNSLERSAEYNDPSQIQTTGGTISRGMTREQILQRLNEIKQEKSNIHGIRVDSSGYDSRKIKHDLEQEERELRKKLLNSGLVGENGNNGNQMPIVASTGDGYDENGQYHLTGAIFDNSKKEKNSWLASGWERFKSWFGGGKNITRGLASVDIIDMPLQKNVKNKRSIQKNGLQTDWTQITQPDNEIKKVFDGVIDDKECSDCTNFTIVDVGFSPKSANLLKEHGAKLEHYYSGVGKLGNDVTHGDIVLRNVIDEYEKLGGNPDKLRIRLVNIDDISLSNSNLYNEVLNNLAKNSHLNISLGPSVNPDDQVMKSLHEILPSIEKRNEDGYLTVISSGNTANESGGLRPVFPANVPGVISVGGMDSGGTRLPFSQEGRYYANNASMFTIEKKSDESTDEYFDRLAENKVKARDNNSYWQDAMEKIRKEDPSFAQGEWTRNKEQRVTNMAEVLKKKDRIAWKEYFKKESELGGDNATSFTAPRVATVLAKIIHTEKEKGNKITTQQAEEIFDKLLRDKAQDNQYNIDINSYASAETIKALSGMTTPQYSAALNQYEHSLSCYNNKDGCDTGKEKNGSLDQQVVKVRSIKDDIAVPGYLLNNKKGNNKEKKGWLVSGWEKFRSWFGGGKNRTETTDKDIASFDSGAGDTITGLGGSKKDKQITASKKQADDNVAENLASSIQVKRNEIARDVRQKVMRHVESDEYLKKLINEFNGDEVAAKKEQQDRLNRIASVDIDVNYQVPRNDSENKLPKHADGVFRWPENKIYISKDIPIRSLALSLEDRLEHELGHTVTTAEMFITPTAKKILAETYQSPGELANEYGVTVANDPSFSEDYLKNITERYARKQQVEFEMERLGIKKYNEPFTKESYDKLLKAYKQGKLSDDAMIFMETTKNDLNSYKQIFNEIADTKQYATGNQDELYAETRPYNPKTDGDIVDPITGEKVQLAQSKKKGWLDKIGSLTEKIFGPKDSVAGEGGSDKKKYVIDSYGNVTDPTTGLLKGYAPEVWKKYSDNARKKIQSDPSNTSQQSAKLKAIEEKNGWLASGWERFKSWFGGNKNRTETTDKDIASFDSGAGDTIAGLEGDNNTYAQEGIGGISRAAVSNNTQATVASNNSQTVNVLKGKDIASRYGDGCKSGKCKYHIFVTDGGFRGVKSLVDNYGFTIEGAYADGNYGPEELKDSLNGKEFPDNGKILLTGKQRHGTLVLARMMSDMQANGIDPREVGVTLYQSSLRTSSLLSALKKAKDVAENKGLDVYHSSIGSGEAVKAQESIDSGDLNFITNTRNTINLENELKNKGVIVSHSAGNSTTNETGRYSAYDARHIIDPNKQSAINWGAVNEVGYLKWFSKDPGEKGLYGVDKLVDIPGENNDGNADIVEEYAHEVAQQKREAVAENLKPLLDAGKISQDVYNEEKEKAYNKKYNEVIADKKGGNILKKYEKIPSQGTSFAHYPAVLLGIKEKEPIPSEKYDYNGDGKWQQDELEHRVKDGIKTGEISDPNIYASYRHATSRFREVMADAFISPQKFKDVLNEVASKQSPGKILSPLKDKYVKNKYDLFNNPDGILASVYDTKKLMKHYHIISDLNQHITQDDVNKLIEIIDNEKSNNNSYINTYGKDEKLNAEVILKFIKKDKLPRLLNAENEVRQQNIYKSSNWAEASRNLHLDEERVNLYGKIRLKKDGYYTKDEKTGEYKECSSFSGHIPFSGCNSADEYKYDKGVLLVDDKSGVQNYSGATLPSSSVNNGNNLVKSSYVQEGVSFGLGDVLGFIDSTKRFIKNPKRFVKGNAKDIKKIAETVFGSSSLPGWLFVAGSNMTNFPDITMNYLTSDANDRGAQFTSAAGEEFKNDVKSLKAFFESGDAVSKAAKSALQLGGSQMIANQFGIKSSQGKALLARGINNIANNIGSGKSSDALVGQLANDLRRAGVETTKKELENQINKVINNNLPVIAQYKALKRLADESDTKIANLQKMINDTDSDLSLRDGYKQQLKKLTEAKKEIGKKIEKIEKIAGKVDFESQKTLKKGGIPVLKDDAKVKPGQDKKEEDKSLFDSIGEFVTGIFTGVDDALEESVNGATRSLEELAGSSQDYVQEINDVTKNKPAVEREISAKLSVKKDTVGLNEFEQYEDGYLRGYIPEKAYEKFLKNGLKEKTVSADQYDRFLQIKKARLEKDISSGAYDKDVIKEKERELRTINKRIKEIKILEKVTKGNSDDNSDVSNQADDQQAVPRNVENKEPIIELKDYPKIKPADWKNNPDSFVDNETGQLTEDAKKAGYILKNGQVINKNDIQELEKGEVYSLNEKTGKYEKCSIGGRIFGRLAGCYDAEKLAQRDSNVVVLPVVRPTFKKITIEKDKYYEFDDKGRVRECFFNTTLFGCTKGSEFGKVLEEGDNKVKQSSEDTDKATTRAGNDTDKTDQTSPQAKIDKQEAVVGDSVDYKQVSYENGAQDFDGENASVQDWYSGSVDRSTKASTKPPKKEKGFWSRFNPLNWFGGKEKDAYEQAGEEFVGDIKKGTVEYVNIDDVNQTLSISKDDASGMDTFEQGGHKYMRADLYNEENGIGGAWDKFSQNQQQELRDKISSSDVDTEKINDYDDDFTGMYDEMPDENRGGAWDKFKEDLSNSWVFGKNKKNNNTEDIFKIDEVESDDRSSSFEDWPDDGVAGDTIKVGSEPHDNIDVSNEGNYSGDDWGEDLGDTVNDRQTTGNGGVSDNDAQEIQLFDADGNLLHVNSSGESNVLQSAGNAEPEKNSYGLDKFLHELLPVSRRINQRVMDYVLEHPGEIDQNKILQIAGDELVRYEVNKLGVSVFGDEDGKVSWFGRDVIKSTEDLASAVVHGDPNAAWVAGVDFLLSTALDSAKQSSSLVGKEGIIDDETFKDIRDGGEEAILTGVKTYLDTGDMDTALKMTGAKLGDYYINKVVTPYLEDQFTDLADNFVGDANLSSGIGAGVGTAFGVGGGNALLQWAATGKVDVEQVAVASFEPAVEAGLNAYYGIDILQNQVDTAMAAVEAGQEGAEVALGVAENELQAASETIKEILPYVKVAVFAYKVTKIFDDGKITIQEVKSMVDSAVVGELMTMGPYGWAAAAVYLVVSSFCCKKKVPKDYEIADAKTSAQEAINPSFMIKGLPGEELSKVIMVARSGDVDKAKSMMNDVLHKSALGKIADMIGLSPLFDSALALMNNRITRLRNDFKPGELEGYTGDNIHTGDTALDEATNKYMHLKNKLKDCYLRKDKDCVNDVSMEIRKVRNGLIALATNKFNDEIAELNKEIHDLENQLAQAKSAKERAELQARLSRARNRRDTLRQARDQYVEIAHSCPPKTMWHFVDHYCAPISGAKAHCEKGGGTWHQANPLTCDGSYCECKCEKGSGGHWMGDHCEYGFNEKQQEQLKLRDAADACSHKIGHWRWDGHNCVEVSSKPPKRPKPSVNQATRFGGDDDSEGE